MTGDRPGWDNYFLGIARAVAARADCSRAQHGAVIVRENRIISAGYNGAPAGRPGCLSGACPRANSTVPSLSGYDNCVSIHAEANAMLYAARTEMVNATLYVTGQPCQWCLKTGAAAGLTRMIWN